MKKALIYILIFILLGISSNYSINYVLGQQIEKQSPYYLSFASIGAIYLESRLDGWAKIKTNSLPEDLTDYMNHILRSLNLLAKPEQITFAATEFTTAANFKAENPKQSIFINIKSDNQLNETYFMVTIVSRDKNIFLPDYEKKLNQNIGLKWNYNHLYHGEIPHLIAEQAGEELVKVVLTNMKARPIEMYKQGELVSVSAYSPLLADTIAALELNDKKYNLQAALRRNQHEAKTEIYLGSPLILDEI